MMIIGARRLTAYVITLISLLVYTIYCNLLNVPIDIVKAGISCHSIIFMAFCGNDILSKTTAIFKKETPPPIQTKETKENVNIQQISE